MTDEPPKVDRLALALEVAAKGFRVFPCAPDTEPGKKAKAPWPGCEWKQEATIDERVIRDWFRDRPGMNYGVAMDAHHFVLDLDRKANMNGRDDLTVLEIDYDNMPATFTVTTPSGGEHLYLVGAAPNSVRKKSLGQAIDVRGDGGYVVGPGSMIDGKPYEITKDCEIAAAPEWLLSLAAKTIFEPVKRDPNISLDVPGEIGRMRAYLGNLVEQGDVAIEHCGGNDRTYKLFSWLLDHVSEDAAFNLVTKHWNPNCLPPWTGDELRGVLNNAVAYRQNDIGAKAALPVSQAFSEALGRLPKDDKPRGKLLRSVSFADLMLRPSKPIEEIVPGLIEKGVATMLAGHGGTHKSRFAQQLGLSIQAGIPIFGKVAEPCTFVYLDYENGEAEITRRTQKMRTRLKLPDDTAGHYFDMKTGALDPTKGPLPASEMSLPLALIEDTGITCSPLYFEVYDFLRSIPDHKFVVADSCYNLLNFTGQTKINESSVKAALNLLDYLCAATNSTMIYLWHPSQSGLERGDASGWSVAWNNTPRARLSLTAVKNTEDAYTLAVEKRNNGPKGRPITLHWNDGVLLPRSEVDTAQQSTLFLEACIKVAVMSAENSAPITRQRNLDGWQVDEIERGAGYRPSQREIKDQLARALSLGRLRYIKGYGKQQAGYFPRETDPALHRQSRIDGTHGSTRL